MKKILFILIFIFCLSSCQLGTRKFGGNTTIKLEPGKELIEVTWKNNNIWYLVEPMDSDYNPKTKEFIESSLFGVMEGKIIFIETK